jgi:hypothetical protein
MLWIRKAEFWQFSPRLPLSDGKGIPFDAVGCTASHFGDWSCEAPTRDCEKNHKFAFQPVDSAPAQK